MNDKVPRMWPSTVAAQPHRYAQIRADSRVDPAP